MASQMVDARVRRTAVEISAAGPGGAPAVYKAEGKAYTTVDPKKLIVVAFLQAYVFAVLTCLYLSDAINLHKH